MIVPLDFLRRFSKKAVAVYGSTLEKLTFSLLFVD